MPEDVAALADTLVKLSQAGAAVFPNPEIEEQMLESMGMPTTFHKQMSASKVNPMGGLSGAQPYNPAVGVLPPEPGTGQTTHLNRAPSTTPAPKSPDELNANPSGTPEPKPPFA